MLPMVEFHRAEGQVICELALRREIACDELRIEWSGQRSVALRSCRVIATVCRRLCFHLLERLLSAPVLYFVCKGRATLLGAAFLSSVQFKERPEGGTQLVRAILGAPLILLFLCKMESW